MTDLIYAIDTSYDDVTPDKARAVREAGIELALQCLWTGAAQPPHRVTNLRNYTTAGLLIGAYTSLPTNATAGQTHVDSARRGVPADLWDALVRCAVDIELDGITPTAIRDAVQTLAAISHHRTIYTNKNTWLHKLGDPHDFTDCELWNAWWDEDPDRDFDANPYGGWRPDQVIAEQYSGGHQVTGVYADRDVFYCTRDRLLGQPTTAIVTAATGLLHLRIAVLERGIDATRAGDAHALRQLADFIGDPP
jgi:hypothetical protein